MSDLVDVILTSIEIKLASTEELIGQIEIPQDEITRVGDIAECEGTDGSCKVSYKLETYTEPNPGAQDLVQKELQKIRKFREQFKRFRVLLGPLELVDPKNPINTQFVTLGDIPISTRYFTQWLTKKLLQRQEVQYPLATFLNQFINELLKDFMNSDTCFNGQVKQRVRLFQSALTSYRDELESGENLDNVTQQILKNGTGARLNIANSERTPIMNISGDRGVPDGGDGGFEREINYLTYFAGRTQPTEQMNGVREEDEERGLFHYGIGRDRGIIKAIDFKKTSAPSLKMVRFEQQGYDGLQQLREQYDANLKTYANINAFPGHYIYIEPSSFAPNSTTDLTQLGIGGYHMIVRTEHSLAPGFAETSIVAKWVAEIDQAEPPPPEPTILESGAILDDPPKKCWFNSERAARAKD
jgi:hypothetical protein